MNSADGSFECEFLAGVTEPIACQQRRSGINKESGYIPDPLGVKAAAVAAFGDMPIFTGWALPPFGVNAGVKAGDSTFRVFFWLRYTQLTTPALSGEELTR